MCPWSKDSGLIGGRCNRVSGPSGFMVRLPFDDFRAAAAGWCRAVRRQII